jgi:Uncharacterized protein conserved in archaea
VSQPSLLVSVRCVDEVAAAIEGGAKIIDVKEPSHGSLEMALPETLAASSVAVPERLL